MKSLRIGAVTLGLGLLGLTMAGCGGNGTTNPLGVAPVINTNNVGQPQTARTFAVTGNSFGVGGNHVNQNTSATSSTAALTMVPFINNVPGTPQNIGLTPSGSTAIGGGVNAVAASPNGLFVYALDGSPTKAISRINDREFEFNDFEVQVYSVDPLTGELAPNGNNFQLNRHSRFNEIVNNAGNRPIGEAVSVDGQFLYVATGNQVFTFQISQSGPTLGQLIPQVAGSNKRATGAPATGLALDGAKITGITATRSADGINCVLVSTNAATNNVISLIQTGLPPTGFSTNPGALAAVGTNGVGTVSNTSGEGTQIASVNVNFPTPVLMAVAVGDGDVPNNLGRKAHATRAQQTITVPNVQAFIIGAGGTLTAAGAPVLNAAGQTDAGGVTEINGTTDSITAADPTGIQPFVVIGTDATANNLALWELLPTGFTSITPLTIGSAGTSPVTSLAFDPTGLTMVAGLNSPQQNIALFHLLPGGTLSVFNTSTAGAAPDSVTAVTTLH